MACKERAGEQGRTPVHPPLKLFTVDVPRIRCRDGVFLFGGLRICQVEMVGYVFRRAACGFYVRDFAGVAFVWSRVSLENGTHKIVCSLVHGADVQCRYSSHRRASFYEEVFFWREAVDYKRRVLAETPVHADSIRHSAPLTIKMARKNVIDKNFTYFSIIREAITGSAEGRATSAQIFDYMMRKHPECFTPLNAVTWKNNVRQLLSKCPEFVKTKKEKTSKLHYWKFVEYSKLVEERYRKSAAEYRADSSPAGMALPTPRHTMSSYMGLHADMGYPDYCQRGPCYLADYYEAGAPPHTPPFVFAPPPRNSEMYHTADYSRHYYNSFAFKHSKSSSESV
ncbi:UNVERIFIED_CONTAM: hypothetical protein PYX00_011672 [Menopon gallinae]|uniref:Fork-head domain-containing protein n=1 Tax=Menopon gallinae TaxID=328185 RepID=A0AAW2H861_9NEOP